MRRLKRILLLSAAFTAVLGLFGMALLSILDWLYPFPLQRIADRLAVSSPLLRASDRSIIAWRVDNEDNRRIALALDKASPWLVEATIAVEDKRFRSHSGVDPVAVGRAILQNATHRRRISGASTITMQTIRLLWSRPRRLESKVIEAFRAWQLERLLDKDRILEIYLNLAPYGGNIVGAEAAARRYFGKGAEQLTLSEACLLAGLPQSPARLNPVRRPAAARCRRDFVAGRLLEEGRITLAQAESVWRDEVRLSPQRPVISADHFTDFALHNSGVSTGSLVTTLDPDLQNRVAALARRKGESLSLQGVSGPAVVVLSLSDSSILAYVGNASPESSPARKVDGAGIRRQPGSLLKPFVFALLADRGAITPSTLVYDLPQAWSDYAPRNMDREWHGEMSAAEALRQSRNITAVRQLDTLGVEAFSSFMRKLGLEPGDRRHGLTLALGGKEQSLLRLTNAYAALGRLGVWLPARSSRDDAQAEGIRVLSAEAAWLTLSALSIPEKEKQPEVVWKTGTSWNQLDAWAVAMTPETVVGVWCGRPYSGGSGWLAGADDALPLALEVLASVSGDIRSAWTTPAGVEFAEVCTTTGSRPGWRCPQVRTAPILTGNHDNFRCRLHAPGIREKSTAGPEKPTRAGGHIRIVSPTPGAVYVAAEGEMLPLVAETSGGAALTWFVDGKPYRPASAGGGVEWPMRYGSHRFSVSDTEGRIGVAEVTVTPREF